MNGYEIRLELLKMAKDMLTEDYYGKKELAHNMWENTRDPVTGVRDSFCEVIPYPTEDEIIAKAEKLNEFLSKAK